MGLSLFLLGTFFATVGDEPLAISRARKIEALLAYLAMNAARPQPRVDLAPLLFPKVIDSMARVNLRQTASRLRRTIYDVQTSSPYVLLTPETMQFNPTSDYYLDVEEFREKLLGCGRHQGRQGLHCPDCMQLLQEAVTLYRGPFLDKFESSFHDDLGGFGEWMREVRLRLHQDALNALMYLSDYHERRGEYELASNYARRQLELERWREESHQQLMRLLARQGKHSAALAQYKQCCRALSEEFEADPSPETEDLHAHILATSRVRLHNLPALGDKSFVGRRKELGNIHQQLARPDRRLLTLVGPGGIGKTQLALEMGWAIITDHFGPFMDGVYFVPLLVADLDRTNVSSTPLVTAIAKALTLLLSGPESPEQQLLSSLQSKECLLIVDNGEHLGESGCALIRELLLSTAGVQILVTSRERLNISGEWMMEIEGLPFPELRTQQQLTRRPMAIGPEVEIYDAIQLFIQRARQLDGRFSLEGMTVQERTSVVRINQLVRGMPLAIEMAAAWVSMLSCQQIAREIEKNVDILTDVEQGRPSRHRSIQAVFEHSWQMLSSQEQRVLSLLSVFRGSFSREAAEQVANATLLILRSLKEKSLLQTIKKQDAMRYEMHPLLRQFAAEKLRQANLEQTFINYACYYGRLLQEKYPHLDGPRTQSTLQQIQDDIENIRAGWLWTIRHHRIDLLNQYVDGLYKFYALRYWRYEGQEMLRQAVALKPKDPLLLRENTESLFFAKLLLRLAEFDYELGSLARAEALLQESRIILHHIEKEDELVLNYEKMGMVAYRNGDYPRAIELLHFSLLIAQDIDNQSRTAHTLMSLGAVVRDLGGHIQAQQFFQESLAYYQALNHPWGIIHSLRLLGTITFRMGDCDRAQGYLEESLKFCQVVNDQVGKGLVWNSQGEIAQAQQQYDVAQERYQQGLALFRKREDYKGIALSHENLGSLMLDLGRYEEAKDFFYVGFEMALKMQDWPQILSILVKAARMLAQQGKEQDAHVHVARLLGFIQQHPASWPAIRAEAVHLLSEFPAPLAASFATSSECAISLKELENLLKSILVSE